MGRKLVTLLEEPRVHVKEDWEKKHMIQGVETYSERASNEGKVGESVNEFGMGEWEDEIPLTRHHLSQINIGTVGAPGGDAPDTCEFVYLQ